MIIIYPSDPSTKFLREVITKISSAVSCDLDRAMPDEYDKTIDFINSSKVSETVLFLGHGNSKELYGGCYVADGRQVLISTKVAREIFKGKKVILLACRSTELILKIEEVFNVAIGFGNIKTDKEDLSTKEEKKKYRDHNSIRIFRENLTTLFANAITESLNSNYNFKQFHNAIILRINKRICTLSLSNDKNDRLAGELLFELKTEMIITGNVNSMVP